MKQDDDDPKWWVTMLKLVLGAAIFIGVIGFALKYAEKFDNSGNMPAAATGWGIVGDSPIRFKR